MLKIASLTQHFDLENPRLKEALHDKGRGYGVVTIQLNQLTFGLPLRSNLNHNYGVVLDTIIHNRRTYKRGLDYTKAVLLRNPSLEIGSVFFVTKSQKTALIRREKMIINQFSRYVSGYVSAANRNVEATLNGPAYRYSTLVNYHSELGINP